jgi:hypothetical protein
MSPTETCAGSLFEQPRYLAAAAAELDAEVTIVERAGALLPLLAFPDGTLRTVPGLPRPYGPNLSVGLAELASELTEPAIRLSATLSPLRGGPELARHLAVRGARLAGERQICVTRLGSGAAASQEMLTRRARAPAAAHGTTAEVTTIGGWLADFGRGAVAFEEPPSRGDTYLAALAQLDHFVIAVHDRDGLAAAAVFLCDGKEAYLHFGGSRAEPAVAPAVDLALAAGIGEAQRLGCRVAVLGGGRSDRSDDPLLRSKLAVAGATLPSFTVDVGFVFD